tara:strand:- start:779 stop:1612 length:834 start_codon:yes stop_codon:yes gene_type:complete
MITAILGVLCFGVADALWRPNVLRYGHFKVLLHRTLLTTIFLGCFFLYNFENQTFDFSMIFVAILSGVIAGVGLYFLVKAFSLESTANILFLSIFTLLVSQLFSLILFDNSINWLQYLIQISLSLLAVLCFNQFNLKIRKGLQYGLLACICFGITYPLAGIPIQSIGYSATIFTQEVVIFAAFLFFSYFNKTTTIDIKMYFDFKIIALSVLSSAAVILFFYSYTLIEIYKVNLISNFHPVGGLLASMIFFKEKLSFLQWCGVVISLMTCVLISGFSL